MTATATETLPPSSPVLTSENLAGALESFNLKQSEYDTIVKELGRDPNYTELAMFSVLWSEHCCYKNSRHLLKKFPNKSPRVLHGPGENAGVVDCGDGIQVAFKIESHNHPTAVEPFQGAATGVGGILRDIFTMNARPVANLNALRFGPLTDSHNHYLFTHAVKGIGHYGNCVGVPTVGGEVFFDETYSGNPLVNAMAVGVVYDNEVMSSKTSKVGSPVLYVGSATGKDGMGGAAFASKELDEQSADDRPAVQVGDPFSEKLLIESCLEAFATGHILAAQDMGAAGLTSSSSEMAAKGEVGMRIDLDKVPAREPDMMPHEFLLSESQERMLFVIDPGKEQEVIAIFERWGVPASIVGEVIAEDALEFTHRDQVVASVPARLLTDLAPLYDRGDNPEPAPEYQNVMEMNPVEGILDIRSSEIEEWLGRLFASANITSPKDVWRQYDRHVRNNTVAASENLSAGVIRLRDKKDDYSGKALAISTDCNSRYVYLNPYQGGLAAVFESARNVAVVGAEPIAVTDNLNFGSPEKQNIYYQMVKSVNGICDACRALEIPVVSGNVSLYNEHSGDSILPAPVIGMAGLIEDETKTVTPAYKEANHRVALVGAFNPAIGGTEYQKLATKNTYGQPPVVDIEKEVAGINWVRQAIEQAQLKSAQDVSLGGLLVTLIESTFENNLGLDIDLSALQTQVPRLDQLLFGETNGTFIVSYDDTETTSLKSASESAGLQWIELGQVTASPELNLQLESDKISLNLSALKETFTNGLQL